MSSTVKVIVATFALLLSAFFSTTAAAATTPPAVVFLGDQVTYGWTSAFAANPNWINEGVSVTGHPTVGTLASGLARFQSDVVSLHPAIVHILFGMDDLETTSAASSEYFEPEVLVNAEAIVQEARAANIQVVFELESGAFVQFNAIIAIYAAQNNIRVIN